MLKLLDPDVWWMVDVNAHKIRSVGVHDSTIPKHMQLLFSGGQFTLQPLNSC